MRPWKKILCPIDHSDCSKAALAAALQLATGRDATVTLLNVTVDLSYPIFEGHVAPRGYLLEANVAEARRELERLRSEVDPGHQRAIDVQVRVGPPGPSIVEEAAEGQYDLIVIGTHGRTGLSRLVLGSCAEYVVRRAPCVVLSIRQPDHAAERPEPATVPIASPAGA